MAGDGFGVKSDTPQTRAAEMTVIGTTGAKPATVKPRGRKYSATVAAEMNRVAAKAPHLVEPRQQSAATKRAFAEPGFAAVEGEDVFGEHRREGQNLRIARHDGGHNASAE